MKYFTKEWYVLCQESDLSASMEIDECAAEFSEDYFSIVYALSEARYLEEIYKDCHGSEDYVYDEETEKHEFNEMYLYRLNQLNRLPESIKSKAADIRLLALNRAEPEVIAAVREHYADICRQINRARDEYEEEEKKNFPNSPPPFADKLNLHDAKVVNVLHDGSDVIITFTKYSSPGIPITYRFRNAAVLLSEANITGYEWLYDEIYPSDAGYEIHAMLVSTEAWPHEGSLVYFTIKCSDVKITNTFRKRM